MLFICATRTQVFGEHKANKTSEQLTHSTHTRTAHSAYVHITIQFRRCVSLSFAVVRRRCQRRCRRGPHRTSYTFSTLRHYDPTECVCVCVCCVVLVRIQFGWRISLCGWHTVFRFTVWFARLSVCRQCGHFGRFRNSSSSSSDRYVKRLLASMAHSVLSSQSTERSPQLPNHRMQLRATIG